MGIKRIGVLAIASVMIMSLSACGTKVNVKVDLPKDSSREPNIEVNVTETNTKSHAVWRDDTSDKDPAAWGEFVRVTDINYFADGKPLEPLGIRVDNIQIGGDEVNALVKEAMEANGVDYYEPYGNVQYALIDFTIDYSEWTHDESGTVVRFDYIDIGTEGQLGMLNEAGDIEMFFNDAPLETLENLDIVKESDEDQLGSYRVYGAVYTDAIDPVIRLGDMGGTNITSGYIKFNNN